MQMEIVEPKKGSDETIKTKFRITKKEWEKCLWIRVWLKRAGADIEKPFKENSRFIYFIVDGDYINGHKK